MAAAAQPEPLEQRLEQAQRYKEEGNGCYQAGRPREAAGRYHRALLQLRGLDPRLPPPLQAALGARPRPRATPQQEAALHRIQTDCYNNLAACLLRMEPVNYERVKEYSLKVLERQPRNAKALYRAGVAAFHLRDYDQARRHLAQAARLQPRDANVKRYLELAESQLSTYHQQEKQLYAGMFG
ncbi:tetratricopeptide repeat protein 9C [Struthio camelus]|uniref:tetratricopeptide repeat protein 9C n=1 Tax=Struthio camelus TaxID=8801 RepID=UPI0036040271